MTAFFRGIHCYGIWLCLLALVSLDLSGYAQTFPGQQQPPVFGGRSGLEGLLGGRGPATAQTGEVFFEGPINPDDYVVGPGDRLDIVFWQPNFTESQVTVNAEGGVVIPYVGVVDVANTTLREARSRIENAVQGAIRAGRVTVALIEPRRFRVNVTGLVTVPGTYVLPATARVADAVALAGGIKRRLTFENGDTVFVPVGSQRRLELRALDGRDLGHADLLAFHEGGLLKENPRLQDGMTIYVPYVQGIPEQIGIFGAVNNGGLYESAVGDDVRTALAVAGGLASNADSSNITVVVANGASSTLNLRGAAGSTALAQPVTAGSRVYVAGFADTSRIGSVTLSGEVARPGGYPIIVGQTTLREVLDKAGGLLPTAAANSARLVRKVRQDPIEPERMRVLEAGLMANPRYSPNDASLAVEFARLDRNTVVVDLSGKGRSEGENVKLQDGDVLEVPKNPLGVRVLGGVNQAGEVAWQPGKDLDYYLAKAGGANKAGWKNRTVVVKARNGSQVQYQSSLPIDPGDIIFLPNKPQQTSWDAFKDIVAVTAQVATVVLIVQNIK